MFFELVQDVFVFNLYNLLPSEKNIIIIAVIQKGMQAYLLSFAFVSTLVLVVDTTKV